jgi:hypothetical protein
MSSNKYFKNRVIMKYSSIIKEFFTLMNQPETLKNISNPNPSLYIGLNAIHRVFEYVLLKMNNVENAYHYSQKCYYYYLEYLEQIHKSDLVQNINHIDVVLFVYKKTIYDIHDGDASSTSNILSLNNENNSLNEPDLRELLNNMSNFTKILFFWDNNNITFDNRIELCENYLQRYLLRIQSLDMVNSYLEIIQQKINLDFKKYNELIYEMLNKIEKTKNLFKFDACEKNEYFLTKFYIEEQIFKEKFYAGNTKELVKWLFV